MTTLKEQLLFIKERKHDYMKVIEFRNKNINTYHSISKEVINHTIFCYDSIIHSLKELQRLKKKNYGK
ncbi:hypothetical protein [uncultured Aquimarina sp.]|uniref:hypothetical protein n=1 Tax=uncultured Aquimarina sp. TaxID=575652 RepID=UPI0026156F2B|nr:hypothetical protein [uncultured Aquimarina sp.]